MAEGGGSPSKPTHLDPSELGTKQYWDAIYATELTNHASNPREEGTVWFDDSDAEAKLLDFLDGIRNGNDADADADAATNAASQQLPPRLDSSATSFLDLGCGNGSLLLALRAAGWRGRLLGVDYSAASVDLARRVAAARKREEEQEEEEGKPEEEREGGEVEVEEEAEGGGVEFVVWDVLDGPLDAVLRHDGAGEGGREAGHAAAGGGGGGWDVVLDKGTFDAVSLSDERDGAGRRVCEGYRDRVLRLLRPGGLFLVTSCNWTETELKGWFEGLGGGEAEGEGQVARFEEVGRIVYPSFSFGGIKGQTISTVCFMKF